jgi:hypothetical protein
MDTPLALPRRIDALPEHTDYSDRGCDLFPSCLNCPLPRCRYEERGGASALIRSGRDASIIAMADERGLSVDALARMFGLSRRTIFRVLRSRAYGGGPGRRGV